VQEALDTLVACMAPITPHICHALWHELGHPEPVIDAAWPDADPAALVSDTISLVVQVNGKLRGNIEVPRHANNEEIISAALAEANVQKFVAGQALKKKIVVPGKLVNLVV
jgi:leucyl-tRNA synthetase